MLHYHKPSPPLLGYLQDEAIIREDIVGSTNTEIKKFDRDNTSTEPFVNEFLRGITIGNSRANKRIISGSNALISHSSSPSFHTTITYLPRFTRAPFF
jgi:hypothetical protein